jgi:3-hydroxyacyl-CoA dehydrogenase
VTTAVTSNRIGDALVITIDNPPVNALGAHVRGGIAAALELAEQDPGAQMVFLCGAGRLFSAGADIREFGQSPQRPALPELCSQIEESRKPVIALLHGSTLGGALEISLAAHYRLASRNTKLGFPEVLLGLIPGAGGTQRLPRLIGVRPALELMLGGHTVDADAAMALGLIDRLIGEEDPMSAAIAAVDEILASRTRRRARDTVATTVDSVDSAALNAARAKLPRDGRGSFASTCIIQAVEASLHTPFEEGLAHERTLFLQCVASPEHAGLKHAFFAEREAAKAPQITPASTRPIIEAGVVGGGTMGVGITVALLQAGLPVTLVERDSDALARGKGQIDKLFDGFVAKNKMSPEQRTSALGRLNRSTSYDSVASADIIIEAVFEEMDAKKEVFAALDRVCKPGAVLTTNTSYLDVNTIAASTSRPSDVLGLHFFSPAHIMKLLEIVVPDNVSADVVATGFELAKRLRKTPVRAGVCDGFIGNRMLSVYRQCADAMMEDGASPYQIDEAIREFGFPMGPYQMADLAGGDIGWATRKRRAATRNPNARYVQIADRLCERGWFGQKSGRGYYLYPQGARLGSPAQEVEELINEERLRAGITPRTFTKAEITRRYLAAMVNEGANVVLERIALRPLDVDVVLMFGYGFPRYRGGPMKFADMTGLPSILADIDQFAEEDPLFWKPSSLLVNLVAHGSNFDHLNRPDEKTHA